MTGEIIVTRRAAVRGQLDTAIELLAFQGDAISAHTLACAASSVMSALAKHGGKIPFHEHFKDYIVPEMLGEWYAAVNRTYNFSKHADRDPEVAETTFNPAATDFEIFEGVEDYALTFGQLSFPMAAFRCYMILQHPKIYLESFKVPIAAELAVMKSIAPTPIDALAMLLREYKAGKAIPDVANLEA